MSPKFMRCEMIPDIDSHFQPFLHPPLLGDTVSIGQDESRSTSTVSYTTTDELSARKKSRSNAGKSEVVLMEIKQQGEEMLKHLSEASQDRKLTLQAKQRNHNFRARLEVAKALGDTEELRKLMAEAKRYYQGES